MLEVTTQHSEQQHEQQIEAAAALSFCPEKKAETELGLYSSEALANLVAQGLTALVELRPYIAELWRRFDALPPGETIRGCTTKKEFCDTILKKDPRTVRYMLAGGNPSNKKKAEIISAPPEEHIAENVSIAPATFNDELRQRFAQQAFASPETLNEKTEGDVESERIARLRAITISLADSIEELLQAAYRRAPELLRDQRINLLMVLRDVFNGAIESGEEFEPTERKSRRVYKGWPTPTARDWKGPCGRSRPNKRASSSPNSEIVGQKTKLSLDLPAKALLLEDPGTADAAKLFNRTTDAVEPQPAMAELAIPTTPAEARLIGLPIASATKPQTNIPPTAPIAESTEGDALTETPPTEATPNWTYDPDFLSAEDADLLYQRMLAEPWQPEVGVGEHRHEIHYGVSYNKGGPRDKEIPEIPEFLLNAA